MMNTERSYRTTKHYGVRQVLNATEYKAKHPEALIATCGGCDKSWDDSFVTGITPAPSSLCPFCHGGA